MGVSANLINLTIFGATEICRSRGESPIFDAIKMNYFFEEKGLEYSKTIRSQCIIPKSDEEVTETLRNLVVARMMWYVWPNEEKREMDLGTMHHAYSSLNKEEKQIADKFGRKFYDELHLTP